MAGSAGGLGWRLLVVAGFVVHRPGMPLKLLPLFVVSFAYAVRQDAGDEAGGYAAYDTTHDQIIERSHHGRFPVTLSNVKWAATRPGLGPPESWNIC